MSKIVECVPNFSEGRRPEVVDAIVAAIKSAGGITLLDKEMDAAHNRAVVTFVGEPEAVLEGAYRGTAKAAELIDLTKHQGEHPRMGATDVCPFIPIAGVSNEECVDLAKRLAKRVADELKIPTYLYEMAAQRPERVDLANIRKGEFEGLREAIKTDPNRKPDFGPSEVHPTAGATVFGARFPLIAYNVNLNTNDVEIAKKIAKALRFRDGGFRYAKAMGFEIKEKNCAQVSINMTNYTGTPLYRAFEFVKREAERYGVGVKESEIIGLVPQQALIDTAVWYMQMDSFKNEQILESHLAKAPGKASFVDELAAPTATPGGGSASAHSGAMGTGLLEMVAGLTIGKKGYEEFSEKMVAAKAALAPLRSKFETLVDSDAEAFEQVMGAFRLPKGTDAERSARAEAIQQATQGACEVPVQVMELAVEALQHGMFVAQHGNKNSITDAGVGAMCLRTAIQGARYNVLINLSGLKDSEYVEKIRAKTAGLLQQGLNLCSAIEGLVEKEVGTS